MTHRPARTWVAAAVGLAVQAVTLVVLTVALAREAATVGDGDGRGSFSAFVDDLFGPAIYTVAAVLVGAFALLTVLALVLTASRGGGRVAGLVVGLVLQVPVTGLAVRAVVVGAAGAAEVAVVVGAGLLLVAVVVPSTWRRAPAPDPHPGPGSSYSSGPALP